MALQQSLQRAKDTARRDNAAAASAAAATVATLIVLALGVSTLMTALRTRSDLLLMPQGLGMPLFLPGLRLTPYGDQAYATALAEDFAAALLLAAVYANLRRFARKRPDARWFRRTLAGWRALLLGALAGNAFVGLVNARMVGATALGWLEYGAAGLVSGVVFGLLLGIPVAIAAGVGPQVLRVRSAPNPPLSSQSPSPSSPTSPSPSP